MGFDYFIKVRGECSILDFIKVNRNNWLKSYQEDEKKFIVEAQEWSKNIDNRTSFIQEIHDIDFDESDFTLYLIHSDGYDSDEDENEKFRVTDYANLIFFEILLLAIDQKDPNLIDYLKILNRVEYLSVKEDNVIIIIYYKSSYKGSEKLVINFSKIDNKITKIKEMYSSMDVYTQLGSS